MLGYFVQDVKLEVMMRLRKKVTKFLKFQVILQNKYGPDKKKGPIDICMCENLRLLTQGRREKLKGKFISHVTVTSLKLRKVS